jgi:hypothetical protein
VKSPKRFIFSELVGEPRFRHVVRGIYSLEGDTLKLSFNAAADSPPPEAWSRPKPGLYVAVWKRVKKP